MSSRTVVMGQKRRMPNLVSDKKPITPPQTAVVEKKVKFIEVEPKIEKPQGMYRVHFYDDLKKTKFKETQTYNNMKDIMERLKVGKTTFYKYLKLNKEAPKNYIIEKI